MEGFKHTITPDPEVLAVIVTCTEFARLEDGRSQAKLDQRLETPLAERTENVLGELGGRWDRDQSCMVLPQGIDPDRVIEQLLEEGSVTVTATLALSV